MLTKVDKAWTAALVSFASLTLMQFFGITVDATIQNAIVAVLSGILTWAVPNKA